MDKYEDKLIGALNSKLGGEDDPRSDVEISEDLMSNHQYKEEEYIEGWDKAEWKIIHVPMKNPIALPGRANPVEQYFRGNPEQLLVQRLLVSEKKARAIINILKKKGFKISP